VTVRRWRGSCRGCSASGRRRAPRCWTWSASCGAPSAGRSSARPSWPAPSRTRHSWTACWRGAAPPQRRPAGSDGCSTSPRRTWRPSCSRRWLWRRAPRSAMPSRPRQHPKARAVPPRTWYGTSCSGRSRRRSTSRWGTCSPPPRLPSHGRRWAARRFRSWCSRLIA
jgi:hypothetical protein